MRNTTYGFVKFLLLIVMLGCSSPEENEQEEIISGPLPDNSIYHSEATFTNQNGEEMQFSSLRGKPIVAAMVFTNCDFACPTITDDMKKIQASLSEEKQDKVQFVLISFDTKRDTAETLLRFANKMELNDNWTLLHGSEEDVRQVSMLLGTHYKDTGGGLFSHDNIITVLNSEGEIVTRNEGLKKNNSKLTEEIEQL